MLINDFSSDKELEKKVEIFALDAMREAENKSKMLGITINQIANIVPARKQYRR